MRLRDPPSSTQRHTCQSCRASVSYRARALRPSRADHGAAIACARRRHAKRRGMCVVSVKAPTLEDNLHGRGQSPVDISPSTTARTRLTIHDWSRRSGAAHSRNHPLSPPTPLPFPPLPCTAATSDHAFWPHKPPALHRLSVVLATDVARLGAACCHTRRPCEATYGHSEHTDTAERTLLR